MPRPSTQSAGRRGEDAAVRHLERKGCQILARNYRKAFGEVDIIARQGKTLVFIEVKARSSARFGNPAEAVTPAKQLRLSKIALDYMMREALQDQPARFDVISVFLSPQGEVERIEQIENAFEAQLP